MDKQTTVVILSSEQLNNIQMLEKYSQEIEHFMKENIPDNSLITIGVIKNVNLINFLENNGYEITRKNQRAGSLGNSNQKLIRDNERVLFFNYPDSSKITEFIGYVRGLDGKDFRVLELGCKYEVFFEKIKKFKEEQNQQKINGKNDFNILTTVRKYHDEVYLHSAMIGALLNPQGLHYRGSLFLELFLETVGLKDWGLNLKNTSVYVEYKNIDLYITDGAKHIIIENKIYAKDQKCQIIRYINIIVEENKKIFENSITNDNIIDEKSLRVIYLTPQDKEFPDEHKKENNYIAFAGNSERLKDCSNYENDDNIEKYELKPYEAKYQKISYKKEILQWLKNSHDAIKNIMNLNEIFKQYLDVVKMVNNNYEGKVMQLEDKLFKNQELFELAREVSIAYKKAVDKKTQEERDLSIELLKNILKTINVHFEVLSWHAIDIHQQIIRLIINDNGLTIQVNNRTNIERELKLLNKNFNLVSKKSFVELKFGKIDTNDFNKVEILIQQIIKKVKEKYDPI